MTVLALSLNGPERNVVEGIGQLRDNLHGHFYRVPLMLEILYGWRLPGIAFNIHLGVKIDHRCASNSGSGRSATR